MSHWKKVGQKANLNKLLAILAEMGELDFGRLRGKMEVSEPTLAEYIKILENQKKIECFFKPEDRRHKWYKIKPENREKVSHQITKYDLMDFIEHSPTVQLDSETLNVSTEFPGWYSKLKRWQKNPERAPVTTKELSKFSARFESRLVREWQAELTIKFTEYLRNRHSEETEESLASLASSISEQFFAFLEAGVRISLFTSLNIKPMGISRFKVGSGGVDKDFYADFYAQIFDRVVALLYDIYVKQGRDVKRLLLETKGSRIVVVVDAVTDFAKFVNMEEYLYFENLVRFKRGESPLSLFDIEETKLDEYISRLKRTKAN